MSNHVSARYGVPCSKCGAGHADACRTKGGRVTDTHVARINAYWSDYRTSGRDDQCVGFGCTKMRDGDEPADSMWWRDYGACSWTCAADYYGEEVMP